MKAEAMRVLGTYGRFALPGMPVLQGYKEAPTSGHPDGGTVAEQEVLPTLPTSSAATGRQVLPVLGEIPEPIVTFVTQDVTRPEGDLFAFFVTLDRPLEEERTYYYNIYIPGVFHPTSEGVDFSFDVSDITITDLAFFEPLTFAPGQTFHVIFVLTTDDPVRELDDEFQLYILDERPENEGGVNITPNVPPERFPDIVVARTKGVIQNDDVLIIRVADATGLEGGVLRFIVSLPYENGRDSPEHWLSREEDRTYWYSDYPGSASADDYTRTGLRPLIFAPGEVTKVIEIAALDDGVRESDEDFYLYVVAQPADLLEVEPIYPYNQYHFGAGPASPEQYLARARGTIQDSSPRFSVTDATGVEGGGASGILPLRFTITLDSEIDADVTVRYEIRTELTASAQDLGAFGAVRVVDPSSGYLAYGNGEIVFSVGGEQNVVLEVFTVNDGMYEPEEQFYLYLLPDGSAGDDVGYLTRAVGTILDYDRLPVILPPPAKPVYSLEQVADKMIAGRLSASYGAGVVGDEGLADVSGARFPAKRLYVDLSGFASTEQIWVKRALKTWSDVSGLEFFYPEVTNDRVFGDFFLRPVQGIDLYFYEHPYEDLPGRSSFSTVRRVFFPDESAEIMLAGVWLNSADRGGHLYAQHTVVRLIGHVLGLAYPEGDRYGEEFFPPSNWVVYPDSALFLNDHAQISVMSNFKGYSAYGATIGNYNRFIDVTWMIPATPMAADILAIQKLYGLPDSTRPGDTIYGYNTNVEQDDVLSYVWRWSYRAAFTIYDTGGIDTVDFSGFSLDQHLDLRARAFSSVNGLQENMVIADGTVIENAIGGAGHDIITGNDAKNRLDGREGADRLTGGAGADTFVYTELQSSTAENPDRILDFSSSEGDRIDLSGLAMALSFIGVQPFSAVPGQVRYEHDQRETSIFVDADGDMDAEFAIYLDGVHALGNTDFLLG